jgi:hypothetical protein
LTLAANLKNYDESEFSARLAGNHLADLLSGFADNGQTVHLMAHSMGNVVASEALRIPEGAAATKNYIASQAATVAGAYNTEEDYLSNHIIPKFNVETGVLVAWLFYNTVEDSVLNTDYHMPTNLYSFVLPPLNPLPPLFPDAVNAGLHGPTSPDLERNTDMQPPNYRTEAYYANLSKVNVINFYNGDDNALSAWEVNTLNRPDIGYQYTIVYDCLAPLISDSKEKELSEREPKPFVGDLYEEGYILKDELTWSRAAPVTEDAAKILSFLTPARTEPLGAVPAVDNVVINSSFVLGKEDEEGKAGLGYGDSGYDHSSQFYKTYAERKQYWENILKEFDFNVD